MKALLILVAASLNVPLAGCNDPQAQILDATPKPANFRATQTRLFQTPDQEQTFKAVLATLQKLGFVPEKVDDTLHLVSAVEPSGRVVHIMVTVQPYTNNMTMVRATAQSDHEMVEDAKAYDIFFTELQGALSRPSMALKE